MRQQNDDIEYVDKHGVCGIRRGTNKLCFASHHFGLLGIRINYHEIIRKVILSC